MYNPSRGGVRGGADQFTWESVKTDKHRENYLGHSLKAPVGRWQKGKDLSWYAKERKESDNLEKSEKSQLTAIKRAEEEAMLIALGHNIIKKESQTLSKEEMSDALKRNIGERDELNIERVDGVGATNRRAALLSGAGKDSKQKKEGISFESHQAKATNISTCEEKTDVSPSKMKKTKKSSKKHKKEKKKKKHRMDSSESDDSYLSYKTKDKIITELDVNEIHRSHSKVLKKKKSKHKRRHSSRSNSSERDNHTYSRHSKQKVHKRHETGNDCASVKRRRHDTSESD